MPNAIDESFGRADWDAAQRAGIEVASLYLSNDPSKNATPADIHHAHQRGIGILLNWEAMAGAPLNGAGQGTQDAQEWVRQKNDLIRAVGYAPKNKLGAYFSCDRDTTPNDYPKIDAYYGATQKVVHADGSRNGAYGEFDLIEHLIKTGLIEVAWQTLAWSNGRISQSADFYQQSINNTLGGASVDFDRIIHPAHLCAWWPPDSPYNTTGVFTVDAESKKEITELLNAQERRLVARIHDAVESAIAELTGRIGHVIHKDAAHPFAQEVTGPQIAEIHAAVTGKAGQ